MKWRVTPTLIAVVAVGLTSLACVVEDLLPREALGRRHNQPVEGPSCLAYFDVKYEVLDSEVNEFGTRECRYKLTITNTDKAATIWPFFYIWEEDGYQNTKEGGWQSYEALRPGESREWFGKHITYTDPDASGAYVLEVQRIGALYDTPQCQELLSDARQVGENATLEQATFARPANPCAPFK